MTRQSVKEVHGIIGVEQSLFFIYSSTACAFFGNGMAAMSAPIFYTHKHEDMVKDSTISTQRHSSEMGFWSSM